MNLHDASSPPPDQPDPADQLAGLLRQQADSALHDALARIDDLFAEEAEREAAEGMDPDIIGLLEQLTGAPDAPLTFRSLHDRVHDGRLSWADFWANPQAEAGGMNLFHAVLAAQLAHDRDVIREQPDE